MTAQFNDSFVSGGVIQAAKYSLDSSGNVTGLVLPNGKIRKIVNDIRERVFTCLPSGTSFRKGDFLLATPAWAAGEIVNDGVIRQNAGNLYCVVGVNSLTGIATTAGQAPTTTGTAAVAGTDTIKWLYLGAASSPVSDQSNSPVVTYAVTPASCTRRYDPQNATDVQAFTITGGQYVNLAGGGGAFNGIAPKDSFNTNSFSVDFMTDAPILQINKIQNAGGVQAAQVQSIFVDGVPLYAKGCNGLPWTNFAGNNNLGIVLDFTTKGNKLRRITIKHAAAYNSSPFTGVWIPPQYSVFPYYNPTAYKLFLEGDSITQGANPSNGHIKLSSRLSMLLGCHDVGDCAVGGTGFISSGGGSTVLTRINNVISYAPDILYIAPINNDVGNDATFNPTTRIAAYTSYFNQLLAALPNLIIIAGGGYATVASNLTTGITTAVQVETDMQTAVNNLNNPQVKFLPTISEPSGKWLLGDGHVGTTVNSTHGNSDLMIGDGTDTLHPNIRWLDVMPQRIANGIINSINTMQ